jgi:predicted methyltransferase
MRLTAFAHQQVAAVLKPGDWAIDATAGNGHDTAFLARAVGPTGRVFAFDIQDAALEATSARIGPAASHVALLRAGHETMQVHLPREAFGRITAILFNLGYLPGGDKQVTTQTETSIAALQAALPLLADNGVMSIMVYRGHDAGGAEAAAVLSWIKELPHDWHAALYPTPLDLAAQTPFLVIVARHRS